MTVRYELHVHSRDVLTTSDYDKHTGYDLIKYVDDMPIEIQSIDLYRANGNIKYDIRVQIVAKDIYENSGEVVGSFMFYDGESVAVTAAWLSEIQYYSSAPLLTNDSAIRIFNKIKVEATILTQLSNNLDYNIIIRNCNTSTNYFAEQYLNGQNVFATLPIGEYIGSGSSFYFPNSTSQTDVTIKSVREILDKYYSLVGSDVDLSNVQYGVVNQSDAWYAKFTTDDYNYVFAGNGEANIVDLYGDSFIYADDGNHTINAGNGDDRIYGREANIIDAGDGNDIIYAGDQTLVAHTIGGGAGDDYIYVGHGGDDVRGGSGNNTVYLGSGNDKYTGGDDVDIVDGGSANFSFTDSKDGSFVYTLSADLSGDENTIYLGGGNDRYIGGIGADIVHCGSGADYVYAGLGENYIDLGGDNDQDSVVIDNNALGVDTIANLSSQDDISCIGGFNLETLQQVGNDVVIFGSRGNKVVFKDINLAEDDASMPILKQDDGTVFYWKDGAYREIKPNPYAFANPDNETISALLSKVAYENLTVGFDFNSLDKTKFTMAEIAYLKDNFVVKNTQYNPETGFFGGILENMQTGNIYYAIRGTDKLLGAVGAEDWGILDNGMAIKQFIDAYNFYTEALTPQGETAARIVESSQKPTGVNHYITNVNDEKYYYLQNFIGTNDEINSTTKILLTGASLGGHLAGMLSHRTGKESIIFNAPRYNVTINNNFVEFKNGHQYTTPYSAYAALVGILVKGVYTKALHIYNDNYFENNMTGYTRWDTEKKVSEAGDFESAKQALECINETYYVYNTIREIITDAKIIGLEKDINLEATFDMVYRAYCLANGKPNTVLSYTDSITTKGYADEIADWLQRTDYKVLVDNHPVDYNKGGITGTDNDDLVFLGNGKDIVSTKAGNDVVYATEINKTAGATDVSSVDKGVYLGVGSDTFYGFNGNDYVNGGSGSEGDVATDINVIYLGGGTDNYMGGKGIDIVDGGSGATGNLDKSLYGDIQEFMTDKASDINTVNLGDGNNIYYCGLGTDIVTGGGGNDTYYWNGSGFDTIKDSMGKNNIVFGAGISKEDIITEYVSSGTINFYTNMNKQEGISFQGSQLQTRMSFSDNPEESCIIGEAGLTYHQKDTAETINGTSGNDVIYANGGNDTIKGGEGDDAYIYKLGDGFDTITETGGNDKIVFDGISAADLTVEQSRQTLTLRIKGDSTAGIRINNQFSSSPSKIEMFEFSNGTLDISSYTSAAQLIQAMSTFGVSNSASTENFGNPMQNVSEMYDSFACGNDLNRKVV